MGFQQTYKAANDIETSQTEHYYKLFRIQRSIYLYKNITYLILLNLLKIEFKLIRSLIHPKVTNVIKISLI